MGMSLTERVKFEKTDGSSSGHKEHDFIVLVHGDIRRRSGSQYWAAGVENGSMNKKKLG